MAGPRATVVRLAKTALIRAESALERHTEPSSIPLRLGSASATTSVEGYWTRHLVNSTPFRSAGESMRYLAQRSEEYPLFERLMELDADPRTTSCSTTDAVRATTSSASPCAARLGGSSGDGRLDACPAARATCLALHGLDASRVELIQVSDDEPVLPLATGSIDYLFCEGVLHHTTHPDAILAELARAVRPGGRGHIMVYNRDSLWFHLYTAYCRQIVDGDFAGLPWKRTFQRNTDGEDCPIARAYRPEEFAALCRTAGFQVSYLGGYFAVQELALVETTLPAALADARLPDEQREFFGKLTTDADGYARYAGSYAGIGGVYRVDREP